MKTTKYKYQDKIYTVRDFGERIKNQEKQMILNCENNIVIVSEKFFENNFKLV